MKRDGSPSQQLIGELWNQLFGELMRSVDVIPPSNHAGEFERAVIALDQEFGPGLGGGVGVGGFQYVFFLHGFGFEGFALAVHFVGGDVDESPHAAMAFGRF